MGALFGAIVTPHDIYQQLAVGWLGDVIVLVTIGVIVLVTIGLLWLLWRL